MGESLVLTYSTISVPLPGGAGGRVFNSNDVFNFPEETGAQLSQQVPINVQGMVPLIHECISDCDLYNEKYCLLNYLNCLNVK